jgi:hypothetical protein
MRIVENGLHPDQSRTFRIDRSRTANTQTEYQRLINRYAVAMSAVKGVTGEIIAAQGLTTDEAVDLAARHVLYMSEVTGYESRLVAQNGHPQAKIRRLIGETNKLYASLRRAQDEGQLDKIKRHLVRQSYSFQETGIILLERDEGSEDGIANLRSATKFRMLSEQLPDQVSGFAIPNPSWMDSRYNPVLAKASAK